jgi:hypothetical protein
MPMPVTARDRLETIVADYHHAHSEHRRAGVEGSVRGTLHTRLERLEAHFERLLEESVADEAAREAWRRSLHEGSPSREPPSPCCSSRVVHQPARCLRFGSERMETATCWWTARLEGVAAAEELAEREIPLTFRIDDQEFQEIFEAPTAAVAAARAHFSDPSGEPPWQHAAALAADGLIDGTFALTARGRRALAARRTRR